MPLAQLPPEAQLLFRAARAGVPPAPLDARALAELDWPLVRALADREKVAPMVWQYVARSGVRELPPGAAAVQQLARVISFQMLHLAQRLRTTVRALSQADIPCVLLKGAAMTTTVYDNFADRPMLDIDLLVPPARLREAVEVAKGAGWRWPDGVPATPLLHHHAPAMPDASGSGISLELHGDVIAPGHPFGAGYAGEIVRDARPLSGALDGASVPDPVHLLLHACIHFAWGHILRAGAVRTFRDVDALVRAGTIDWPRFLAAARRYQAESCCYWTFRLAESLAGVQVPAHVRQALRPPLPEPALRLLERHLTLVLLPIGADCPSVTLRRRLWNAAIRPRQSGHGASRPWIKSAPDVDTGVETETDAAAERADDPVAALSGATARRAGGRASAWLHYARSFVRAQPSPAA